MNHLKKPADPYTDYFKAWLEEESTSAGNPIDASENAILRFSESFAILPPASLKGTILEKLKSLQAAERTHQVLDMNDLPTLTADSNWMDWQACVQHITPPANYEGAYLHSLESTPQRDLFVAWVKEFIEEEVHHDLVESFIILEGSCKCNILKADGTTQVVRLVQGDYIEIPVHVSHNIIITSRQPVKAILQWHRKTA